MRAGPGFERRSAGFSVYYHRGHDADFDFEAVTSSHHRQLIERWTVLGLQSRRCFASQRSLVSVNDDANLLPWALALHRDLRGMICRAQGKFELFLAGTWRHTRTAWLPSKARPWIFTASPAAEQGGSAFRPMKVLDCGLKSCILRAEGVSLSQLMAVVNHILGLRPASDRLRKGIRTSGDTESFVAGGNLQCGTRRRWGPA